ncbi:MAG: MFS transporter [Bacteroidota bacterium]|nr:MFS transporter [Bacteroidota bacterium]
MKNNQLSHAQVLLMATAAGVSVANIYFNQPILHNIAASLKINDTEAGSIAVLSQAGYGLGLFFLIPLGDKVSRKKLVAVLFSILILCLLIISFCNTLLPLQIASLAIGVLSVSAHIILPMAASLNKASRGKTLGTVFSGVLIGILAARVFSGFISHWLGWHYVYGISAALVLVMNVLIYAFLPATPSDFKGNYLQLMTSVVQQIKRFPLLRQSAIIGALVFGLFCSFWTTLTFHLSGAPFYFQSDTIGAFALVAIVGALAAPAIGKMADKGNGVKAMFTAMGCIFFSIVLMMLFPLSVASFIVAVLLLDIGVQMIQITNIATIYTLDETAHSRINTVYMTLYFVGGAIGTSVGLWCWQHGGWQWVTVQMLVWAFSALLIIYFGRRKNTRV